MILSFKPQFRQKILDGTKIHTIRDDPNDRWQAGKIIHAATGVRTKNYDCFYQTKCTGKQQIVIEFFNIRFLDKPDLIITIDGKKISIDEMKILAKNDGFDSILRFYEWFFVEAEEKRTPVLNKKLIHWTDFRY